MPIGYNKTWRPGQKKKPEEFKYNLKGRVLLLTELWHFFCWLVLQASDILIVGRVTF